MSLSVWGIGLCVSVASASGHVAGHRVCDGLGGWVGGGGGWWMGWLGTLCGDLGARLDVWHSPCIYKLIKGGVGKIGKGCGLRVSPKMCRVRVYLHSGLHTNKESFGLQFHVQVRVYVTKVGTLRSCVAAVAQRKEKQR